MLGTLILGHAKPVWPLKSRGGVSASFAVFLFVFVIGVVQPAHSDDDVEPAFRAQVQVGEAISNLRLQKDADDWALYFMKEDGSNFGRPVVRRRATMNSGNALFLIQETTSLFSLPENGLKGCSGAQVRLQVPNRKRQWVGCAQGADKTAREVQVWLRLIDYVFK